MALFPQRPAEDVAEVARRFLTPPLPAGDRLASPHPIGASDHESWLFQTGPFRRRIAEPKWPRLSGLAPSYLCSEDGAGGQPLSPCGGSRSAVRDPRLLDALRRARVATHTRPSGLGNARTRLGSYGLARAAHESKSSYRSPGALPTPILEVRSRDPLCPPIHHQRGGACANRQLDNSSSLQ
jgi:hypothetical protein